MSSLLKLFNLHYYKKLQSKFSISQDDITPNFMQTFRLLAYLIDYILSANLAAFIPQKGQVLMPALSIRVAGFASEQVFCELKIILRNCYKRVLFFSII